MHVNINQSPQRIRSHDEVCTHSLEYFAKAPPPDNENNDNNTTAVVDEEQEAIKHSLSYDTAETAEQSMELEWKECPICMEEFKADEIVSWSPDDQTSCLHFFHHECIKGKFYFREPTCNRYLLVAQHVSNPIIFCWCLLTQQKQI